MIDIPDRTFRFQCVLFEVCYFRWNVRDIYLMLLLVSIVAFWNPLNGFYMQFKGEILGNVSPLVWRESDVVVLWVIQGSF